MTLHVKNFEFSAAHHLPNHPGDCKNIHGHTWFLDCEFHVPNISPDETGFSVDFKELKELVKATTAILDHGDLNETLSIPSAENLAFWLFKTIEGYRQLNKYPDTIYLQRLILWESPRAGVEITRFDYEEGLEHGK